MNPKQLQRLLKILKLLKTLKQGQAAQEELNEHRDLFLSLNPQELADVREKADYDPAAWQEILKQFGVAE